MSGHSHFKSIKHKKGIEDIKRAKIFSKFARLISVAARERGGDPRANSELRIAIEKAKSFNMSQENIERAIKKGTGELEGVKLENLVLEGFGPNGIAIIIEAVTDNKNRTLSEIRHILERAEGKLASGGVLWMFERKGVITINLKSQISNLKKEELELLAIEAGAEDIRKKNDILEICTRPEKVEEVKENLEEKGIEVENASLDWIPREEREIENKEVKAKLEKLFEALDDRDDVQEIYSNLRL